MKDKYDRTKNELASDLGKMVANYQIAIKKGNKELSQQLKENIDNIIQLKDLDENLVYNFSNISTIARKAPFS